MWCSFQSLNWQPPFQETVTRSRRAKPCACPPALPPGLPRSAVGAQVSGSGRSSELRCGPMTTPPVMAITFFLPAIGWGQSLSWFWPMRSEERRSFFSGISSVLPGGDHRKAESALLGGGLGCSGVSGPPPTDLLLSGEPVLGFSCQAGRPRHPTGLT